jgi:hypothetical protein
MNIHEFTNDVVTLKCSDYLEYIDSNRGLYNYFGTKVDEVTNMSVIEEISFSRSSYRFLDTIDIAFRILKEL